MDLDKRIAKDKTYIDCFETELAKKFIGKECYVSDDVTSFVNVDNLRKAVLREVDEGSVNPYTLENIRWRYSSNFILPCEWVEEGKPKKIYRPYKNVDELFDDVGLYIGDVIHFRKKFDESEYNELITGTCCDSKGISEVCIGSYYTMQELFDLLELPSDGGWIPFGKEVSEEC